MKTAQSLILALLTGMLLLAANACKQARPDEETISADCASDSTIPVATVQDRCRDFCNLWADPGVFKVPCANPAAPQFSVYFHDTQLLEYFGAEECENGRSCSRDYPGLRIRLGMAQPNGVPGLLMTRVTAKCVEDSVSALWVGWDNDPENDTSQTVEISFVDGLDYHGNLVAYLDSVNNDPATSTPFTPADFYTFLSDRVLAVLNPATEPVTYGARFLFGSVTLTSSGSSYSIELFVDDQVTPVQNSGAEPDENVLDFARPCPPGCPNL